MIVLKIIGIIALIAIIFFIVTFTIYFFNLDMKLMAALIAPLTKYYDWSRDRREKKKAKMKAKEEKVKEV